jgi:hypothetical protein
MQQVHFSLFNWTPWFFWCEIQLDHFLFLFIAEFLHTFRK